MKAARPITILIADDDPDDVLLVEHALREGNHDVELRSVENGEEALDYLLRRGTYRDPRVSPRPDLILLDLNMPIKDGLETLQDIKSDPGLREIPVVILTTSRDKTQISRGYRFGANSFVMKPISFSEMITALDSLCSYWFNIVSLPEQEDRPGRSLDSFLGNDHIPEDRNDTS